MYPPVLELALQQSMAARINSFCRWEQRWMSFSSWQDTGHEGLSSSFLPCSTSPRCYKSLPVLLPSLSCYHPCTVTVPVLLPSLSCYQSLPVRLPSLSCYQSLPVLLPSLSCYRPCPVPVPVRIPKSHCPIPKVSLSCYHPCPVTKVSLSCYHPCPVTKVSLSCYIPVLLPSLSCYQSLLFLSQQQQSLAVLQNEQQIQCISLHLTPRAQLRGDMTLRRTRTDLGHLDGRILGNDSCPTARGVQKHSVKAIHDLKTPAP